MKNRILFAILLIFIATAGINGTKIITAILRINDEEQSKIPRSSVNNDAIYLSPDEISFDPMSMVDKRNSLLVSENNDVNIMYGNGSFDICDIIESLIRNISIYSEKAEYAEPVGAPISDSIYASTNRLYYVEKHMYYNKFGNKRYVDLILDSNSLSIMYINFYDDQQHAVSSETVQRETEKFNNMSTDFFTRVYKSFKSARSDLYYWFYGDSVDWNDEEYPNYYFDAFEAEKNMQPELYISTVCQETKTLYMGTGENNPMIMFFVVASAPYLVIFNYFDYYYDEFGRPLYDEPVYEISLSIDAAAPFVMECGDSGFINNMEFAAYNGRIYMTSEYENVKKIIIYNVLTHEIEGFCNYYNYDGLW